MGRYHAILKGRELPHYLRTKAIQVDFASRSSEDKLWRLHREFDIDLASPVGRENLKGAEGKNRLDLKL
ncbi:MAG: hypothetical protein LUO85_00835, partial [Methanomassiliicoccales archaeon]|nr:hypothetical protein [Methanomassiliicoccales archaeon]